MYIVSDIGKYIDFYYSNLMKTSLPFPPLNSATLLPTVPPSPFIPPSHKPFSSSFFPCHSSSTQTFFSSSFIPTHPFPNILLFFLPSLYFPLLPFLSFTLLLLHTFCLPFHTMSSCLPFISSFLSLILSISSFPYSYSLRVGDGHGEDEVRGNVKPLWVMTVGREDEGQHVPTAALPPPAQPLAHL